MEWISTVWPVWLNTLEWMVGLAVAFGILARLTPCNRGMYWWRDLRAVAADCMYWFVVPLFMRICRLTLLMAGMALLFGGRDSRLLPVGELPLWQQGIAILLIQDVMMYWIHRLFHTRWAWKVHAVHHSPTVLDWMSASRFHPLNVLLSSSLPDVAVLLLGFKWEALAFLVPINIIYSTMVHANLNWTFGPLRFVFASPVFHRWHHTTLEEGLDKNFASTFPLLDIVFGTFYMPPGKVPEHYGTGEPDFPKGFFGQLLHPFMGEHPSGSVATQPVGSLSCVRFTPITATLALAFVGLFGSGIFLMARMARLSDQNRELAQEVEHANKTKRALLLDVAQRALMENDLVNANAILNEVAGPLPRASDLCHLRKLCRDKCLALTGHTGAVLSVAVSGNGHLVASAGEDGTIKIWEAATGKEKCTIQGDKRAIRNVALSNDGSCVLSGGSDGTVRMWEVEKAALVRVLEKHATPVLSVAMSADGKHVLSGSGDLTAKLWDASTGKEEYTLQNHPGAVPSVAVSGDGQRLVRASGTVVKLWNVGLGREECTLKGHRDLVYSVAISRDGKWLVSGSFDGTVKVWDVEAQREERTLTGHSGNVYGVAISPDGRLVVSGGQDCTVKVWDAETGNLDATLKGHLDSVTSVAVSDDGLLIVSGSRDGKVMIWSTEKCCPKRSDVSGGLHRRRKNTADHSTSLLPEHGSLGDTVLMRCGARLQPAESQVALQSSSTASSNLEGSATNQTIGIGKRSPGKNHRTSPEAAHDREQHPDSPSATTTGPLL